VRITSPETTREDESRKGKDLGRHLTFGHGESGFGIAFNGC
jgi:hypothetical protein